MDPISGFAAWAMELIGVWGYLGLFLVEIISNASIIFPAPAFAINFVLGGTPGFDPWLVGLVAGVGAAIGETTGYFVGRGGRRILEKKYEKLLKQTREWMEKHGDFYIIILFAATPLPHDIVGMIAGAVHYPFRRFMIATLIGKVLAGWALAWAGYHSVGFFLTLFSGL